MAKINQLIKEWPKGTVMTLDLLKQIGELVAGRYLHGIWTLPISFRVEHGQFLY
jgi:hypothetical protein